MNKIIYSIVTIICIFGLSSCIIEDKNLEPEILKAFEKERSTGGVFVNDCSVKIIEECYLESTCAFQIELSDAAKGYKYINSDGYLTEEEIYKKAANTTYVINDKKRAYIEKGEYNFITVKNSSTTKYLYIIPYANDTDYGHYISRTYSKPFYVGFTATVKVKNFRRNGNNITWTFEPSDYAYNYVILTGEEATYAMTLTSSEFAIYMTLKNQQTIRKYNQEVDMEFTTDESPVVIGTRAFSSNVNSYDIYRTKIN